MSHISAFRGLRYDLGHVGALEGVVAPPHDEIDADRQDELYKQHPANVIRLILNRDELGDEANDCYRRAGRFFRNWPREGVLQREPDPAIYVYHQIFDYEGSTYTRRGFICLTRIEDSGEGTIHTHEETLSGPRADCLQLIQASKGNLSPILGVYPDAENEVQEMLEQAIVGVAAIETKDRSGVHHRLWPVSDIRVINDVTSCMATKPTYIADGHHRYEAARTYKHEFGADLDSSHGANHVMMMCCGMNDPGMLVLPSHRLFRGLAAITSDDLKTKLTDCFDVRIAGEGSDLAEMIWDQIEIEEEQGTLGFYCHADERWVVAKINEAGRAKMANVSPDLSPEWQSLGVSILHRLVMDAILDELRNASDVTPPQCLHLVDEVVAAIDNGDADGTRFELAALVMPPTLEHVQVFCERGEHLPAQSTYIHPQPLSGLVFNPHD